MIDSNRHCTFNGVNFLNSHCFITVHLQICNCPPLKDISFNTKCLLVWSDLPEIKYLILVIFGINHSRDFEIALKIENFEIALLLRWQFQIFKNALGQFIPNRPCDVITSTN